MSRKPREQKQWTKMHTLDLIKGSPTIGQKVVRTGLQRPILSMFRARPWKLETQSRFTYINRGPVSRRHIYIYIQDTIIIISHLVSRHFWNVGGFFNVAASPLVYFAWTKCSQSHCSYISIWIPCFYTFSRAPLCIHIRGKNACKVTLHTVVYI